MLNTTTASCGRRRFLKSLPFAAGAAAASVAAPARAATDAAVTRDMLSCGEALDNIAFSDAEHELMRAERHREPRAL